MTTDNYTFRAANALPNDEPDITTLTVDQLARERGVSKRYAYALMRRAQAAKMDVPIPTNQREMILTILYRSDGYIRNTDDLSAAVHESGSTLPPHDVTKTLWSLQKSQYVRFRERANGMLYAIKLTPEGKKAAKAVLRPVVDDNELLPADAGTMSTVEEIEPPVVRDESTATVEEDGSVTRHTRVVADFVVEGGPVITEVLTQPDEPAVPWFRGNMGGWPSMREVRDRHLKATKIKSALALLEEVGEDDAVLSLLDKITFTPLEEEVVQLLRFLKEIE
jgi:hypothetical protein